uniref:MIF4G domain-containing protein n=1 Tax=Steinernema glaseri TaxID=37863 RepID=A0A1I7YS02_9BILA
MYMYSLLLTEFITDTAKHSKDPEILNTLCVMLESMELSNLEVKKCLFELQCSSQNARIQETIQHLEALLPQYVGEDGELSSYAEFRGRWFTYDVEEAIVGLLTIVAVLVFAYLLAF